MNSSREEPKSQPLSTLEAEAVTPNLEALVAEAEQLCTSISDDWLGYSDDLGGGRCELFAGPMENGYRTSTVFKVDEDCAEGCFPPSPDEMRFISLARLLLPLLLAERTGRLACYQCGQRLDKPFWPSSDAFISGLCQVCLNGPPPVGGLGGVRP